MDSIDAQHNFIVQNLITDKYQVEFSKGKAYLGCRGFKVVGVFDGQVQEKTGTMHNTLQAQVFFRRASARNQESCQKNRSENKCRKIITVC